MTPLVAIDADVLGRERTGDETYVLHLLRELPRVAGDLRFAAFTRHPDLVPEGVEAIHLPARLQELRMAVAVPRLFRRLRPALGHFQHALPLVPGCPCVVTLHDLSFERDATLMPRRQRAIFKTMVPRSARRAAHVLSVSERTKRDVVELYGIAAERVTVTPHGVDEAFAPGADGAGGYLLFVGAIQERKNPRAAALAARALGMRLVVVGPEREPELARELERLGAEVRGYVDNAKLGELYRGASALVFPSRYEGFGLPVLEAMACGTPVVAFRDEAIVEVAADAAVYADGEEDLPGSILHALDRRAELRAAGLLRAQAFSWEETARRTADVYRRVLAR